MQQIVEVLMLDRSNGHVGPDHQLIGRPRHAREHRYYIIWGVRPLAERISEVLPKKLHQSLSGFKFAEVRAVSFPRHLKWALLRS